MLDVAFGRHLDATLQDRFENLVLEKAQSITTGHRESRLILSLSMNQMTVYNIHPDFLVNLESMLIGDQCERE